MSIKNFKSIDKSDLAGGKGTSLSKMYQNGFNVPNGFIITADIFDVFLTENNVKDKIDRLISSCNFESQNNIEETSNNIIDILKNCKINGSLQSQLIQCYKDMNCKYVAVRSSATSEDGKEHAWAGTLETFLNVDETNIIESIIKCWCSVFKPRALFYRYKNEKNTEVSVAVVIQQMIQSEISGVAFSVNPISNDTNEIVIEAVYGLGEAIVSGKVTPDTYVIDKNELSIKDKSISNQKSKLIQDNKWIDVTNNNSQKLSDDLIINLSNTIKQIEEFYGFPVDVEWGIENNNIYILQSRPITTVKENALLDRIINQGQWKFYVSRKFNWFVENTEILATLEKNQKDLLGFELITLNYLCLNGDEYALDSDFDIFCKKLDNYFENDINFFEKFSKIEFEIVNRIKEYIKYIKSKDYTSLSYTELAEEFEGFNKIYVDSFIPGMTRPEDYLTYKLEKELQSLNYKKEDIDYIFKHISTCPNYDVISYSEEPLDLLKIARQKKEGIDVNNLINDHIEKYAWIKGPLEFEKTCFTKEDYMQRLNNLLNQNIEEKINNINNVRLNNDKEYEETLDKYEFTEKVKKLIKAIRDFIFLRTYTTEYSDHLFYEARSTIFKEIARRTNLLEQDLIMLDYTEIIKILKNNGNIDTSIKQTLEDRKTGFAMIWIDGEIITVFGNESINIQTEISKRFKSINNDNKEINDKVIKGSIANKGRVKGIARILKSYKDIYKVNKGDIIVASMTTPDFVSAMEKASGFITDEGGITCHAAILSREFNVPCIVGTINATDKINDGDLVELDAYNGIISILK